MLLVIDVGNTNTVFGVYKGSELLGRWRMTTATEKTSDEIGLFLTQYLLSIGVLRDNINGVVISSVVPPIMFTLENAIMKYIGKTPIIIDSDTPLGLSLLITNPSDLGADRIVNALAAITIYKKSAVVVDFGTATTFCAVRKNGDYLGGAICAGIKISMDALFSKASKLPRVEIARPPSIIGKTTVSSIQSGTLYGYAGQVDYIVSGIKSEMMEDDDIAVVATGGLAPLIAEEAKSIDVVNTKLTLEGLRIAYERISG